MKDKIFAFLAVIIMVLFTTGTNCYAVDFNDLSYITYSEILPQDGNKLYGSSAAKADTDLTLEDMLTYAIEDEYYSEANYVNIMEKFGEQIPFPDITKAEIVHINALRPFFYIYKFPVPVDNSKDYIKETTNIKESLELGVEIETNNIAMYESFLKQNLPSDVKETFTNLKNASQIHLKAFQNELKNH